MYLLAVPHDTRRNLIGLAPNIFQRSINGVDFLSLFVCTLLIPDLNEFPISLDGDFVAFNSDHRAFPFQGPPNDG
jgi:hypothetical protein